MSLRPSPIAQPHLLQTMFNHVDFSLTSATSHLLFSPSWGGPSYISWICPLNLIFLITSSSWFISSKMSPALVSAVGAVDPTSLRRRALPQRREFPSEHLRGRESQEGDPKATEYADKLWDLFFPSPSSDGHDVVPKRDCPNSKDLVVIERVAVNA